MNIFKKKVPYISQMEHSECGLACFTMVLNYYNYRCSLSEIRDEVGSLPSGYSFYDLFLIAKDKNMHCKAFKVDSDKLSQFESPLILHWDGKHFVVLERVEGNNYFIVDPEKGRKRVNKNEFIKFYSGNALLIEPTESFIERRKKRTNLLLTFLKRQKKHLFSIILVTLLLQVVSIFIPIITQLFTDNVLEGFNPNLINIMGIGVLFIFITHIFTSIFRGYLIAKLQTRLDSLIMSKFMNTLLRLPYLFFNNRASGDLLFRANSNNLIRQLLSTTVISLIIDILLLFSYMIIMFYYSIPLSLILLAVSLIIIITLVLNTTIVKRLSDQNVANQSDVQTVLADSINGITDIKMLGLEDKMYNNWHQKFKSQLNSAEKLNIWNSFISAFTGSIQVIVPLFILWIGSFFLLKGDITLGVLIAFSTISVSFIRPIVSLSGSYSEILSISSYFQRIIDVIETKTEANISPMENMKIKGDIRFENVSYRYSKYSQDVISNISFSIKKGETVAIVGASGSGKSTVAKLLLGFLSPTEGNIYYDNTSIKNFNVTELRKQIGSVMQDSSLFNRSIYENISMFQTNISVESVIEATKKANIFDEIMGQPLQFNTTISENGKNLSGGQVQRMLIARALVKDPALIVLDEASSALDNISERKIHESLSALPATKIIIAHRLSTIKNSDRIMVMSDGNIIEKGTHDSLIKSKGYYFNLYMSNNLDTQERSI